MSACLCSVTLQSTYYTPCTLYIVHTIHRAHYTSYTIYSVHIIHCPQYKMCAHIYNITSLPIGGLQCARHQNTEPTFLFYEGSLQTTFEMFNSVDAQFFFVRCVGPKHRQHCD